MTIGIDLGTTNSCAAYIDDKGKATIIAEEEGNTIASAISIVGQSIMVGKQARDRAMRAPTETIVSAKRLIGLPWFEADRIAKKYGMTVGRGSSNEPLIRIKNSCYTLEQISAEVLTAIKINAEKKLGTKIDSAVITVPAYFNDRQRDATRRAGVLAGLTVDSIISEPTAAALAYQNANGKIAIYDLGGGTFDISIVDKTDETVRVIATGGDLELGGDDIDTAIMKLLATQAEAQTGIKFVNKNGEVENPEYSAAVQKLRNTAEKMKILFSDLSKQKVEVEIEKFFNYKSISVSLTRGQLNLAMKPFVERTLKCCSQALESASLSKEDLDAVVLVGGSTKSPYVRDKVGSFFGRVLDTSLNPDEAVALGAALSVDLSKQNAFVDVTPLNLFIETADNRGSVIIPKGSQLPAISTKTFTTSKDNQTTISFIIRQGTKDNSVRLGTLFVTDIEKGRKGEPKIAIEFSVSKSGLISVKATNVLSGKIQSIEIRRLL